MLTKTCHVHKAFLCSLRPHGLSYAHCRLPENYTALFKNNFRTFQSFPFITHKVCAFHSQLENHKTIQQLWRKYQVTSSVAVLRRRPRGRVTTLGQDRYILNSHLRDRLPRQIGQSVCVDAQYPKTLPGVICVMPD